MNETQAKLLERGVIVLPETLEHPVYEVVLEALVVERPDLPVRIYCKGNGGDTRTALAIADLIEQHGNCVGLLVGDAVSSHVMIWAACQQRYVSPRGALGIHKVASYVTVPIDATYARLLAAEQETDDQMLAVLLARISDVPAVRWVALLQSAGSSGVRRVDASALIAHGMARPLRELEPQPEAVKVRFANGAKP